MKIQHGGHWAASCEDESLRRWREEHQCVPDVAAPVYACGDAHVLHRFDGESVSVRCEIPENEPHAIHRCEFVQLVMLGGREAEPLRSEVTWPRWRPEDEETP